MDNTVRDKVAMTTPSPSGEIERVAEITLREVWRYSHSWEYSMQIVSNALRSVAAQARDEAMADMRRLFKETLQKHWLTGVDCNHEEKTDVARCWCSFWTGTPQPTVILAVMEWVDHVMDEAAMQAENIPEEK